MTTCTFSIKNFRLNPAISTDVIILIRVTVIIILSKLSNITTVAATRNGDDYSNLPFDHEGFADRLTSKLYSTGSSNECSSSLGISMAFSLIYPAAEGDSKVQIRDVLTYPSNSQSQGLIWSDTASRLISANEGTCLYQNTGVYSINVCAPTIKIANSLFVNSKINLNPSYKESIGAYMQELDFSDEAAGEQINTWVSSSTNGLIDSIVEDGPLDSMVIAINSIYLKASWASKFKALYTNEDFFYTTPSRSTKLEGNAHFMHQVNSFDYSEEALPGFQVLKLPFAGSGSLSMILVLPFGEGIEKTEASSEDVLATLPYLQATKVAVGIPKFEFKSKYENALKGALKSLGITAPFAGGLCIEDGDCSVPIDKVIQKTYISIDENGVEAAAVTAVTVMKSLLFMTPTKATLFLADHPMQFFIHDEEENLILFEGRVGSPVIPGSSNALLSANHKDDNFWINQFRADVILPPGFIAPIKEAPIEEARGRLIERIKKLFDLFF